MRHPQHPLRIVALAVALAPLVALAADGPRVGQVLPEFALRDPAGVQFTHKKLASRGAVIVVTAPTLANRDAQRGWADALQKTRPQNGPFLVFVEDMSASWFQETALERMREKYTPGQETLLLIDPEGRVRKELDVPKGETIVLAFAAGGRLAYVEEDGPSPHRAARLWQAIGAQPADR